jgi:hypothetical protein
MLSIVARRSLSGLQNSGDWVVLRIFPLEAASRNSELGQAADYGLPRAFEQIYGRRDEDWIIELSKCGWTSLEG